METEEKREESGCNKQSKTKKIVLAGNPNVGKSLFFKAFTGKYIDVSNFPGSTVEIHEFKVGDRKIIDTPGVYALSNFNDEEKVAGEYILKSDGIINIVNATSLDRDLFFTLQMLDLGLNVVIALNLFDEAKKQNIEIDIKKLQECLNVPIIKTSAIKNEGFEEVKRETEKVLENSPKTCRKTLIKKLEDEIKNKEEVYTERRKRVNEIVKTIVKRKPKPTEKLGEMLLNPFWGGVFAMVVLISLYFVLGVLISGNIVDFLENGLLNKYYVGFVDKMVNEYIKYGVIKSFLTGEFGLLTMPIVYIFGILTPLIAGFYVFMSILEDSGYLPRLAVIVDKTLSKVGLNGRAVIPLILGFGCVTMAVISTRILGSKRERTIASAMLGLVVPCSAQFGIIVGMISNTGGLLGWFVYIGVLFTILVIIGTVLNKLLPGQPKGLMIDIPPMRMPDIKNVARKTYNKTKHFITEAFPIFVFGCVLVNALKITGILAKITEILKPLVTGFLHLPAEFSQIFLMVILRRDFAAAGMLQLTASNSLSFAQTMTGLVVITLFVPCLMAVMVLFKERGWKEASFIWVGSWVIAFTVGEILTRVLELFV